MSQKAVPFHVNFPNILEAIKVGIIVIDEENRIRYCNTAAAEYVGQDSMPFLKNTGFITGKSH